MADLSTNYMGLMLSSPLIASSSGLTATVKEIRELEKHGAGAVVLKSLFEEEIVAELEKQRGRMFANNYLYPETMEFYENDDTQDTLSSYLRLISECKQQVKIPIIASINCITANTWPDFAKTLQDAGADALELNLFILPSNIHSSAAENEALVLDVVKKVKATVSIPVAVKISFYYSSLGSTIKKISDSGVDGIVLFNRFYSPDIDLDVLDVVSANVFSSANDYYLPLQWIGAMSGRVACHMSASTGVHSGETAVKMLLAGAQTVQVASTLYKHGIPHLSNINNEIVAWMEAKGFDKISDFRGMLSQSQVENPAGYERLQFMKYFAKKKC